MSYTRREQTNRRQFLTLLKLLFEMQTLSHVFKDDERAGLLFRVGPERRQSNVEHQGTICMRRGVQFIDLTRLPQVPAVRSQDLVQGVGKIVGKQFLDVLSDGCLARN